VLLSRAPSTTNLGGIVQWGLGMGHITVDTCRAEALSSTMVMSMAMQIFAPKYGQEVDGCDGFCAACMRCSVRVYYTRCAPLIRLVGVSGYAMFPGS
jgi:hypothetical protein